MKILVIGAHPADPIDLAGGTIYQHTRSPEKDEVCLLSLTDGMRSHLDKKFLASYENEDVWYDKVMEIKRKEFDIAGRIVGVAKNQCCIFDFMDEPLILNAERIGYIINHIRKIKPDMVITHHPNEYAHWDHATCGQMVCRALKSAIKLRGDKHWVPTVYFFAVQFRPEVARLGIVPQSPDVLIELDEFAIKAKIDAMCCFKSQGHNDKKAMQKRMDSFESEMGRADGLRYAEGFTLYYPLKRKKLPINIDKGFYK